MSFYLESETTIKTFLVSNEKLWLLRAKRRVLLIAYGHAK